MSNENGPHAVRPEPGIDTGAAPSEAGAHAPVPPEQTHQAGAHEAASANESGPQPGDQQAHGAPPAGTAEDAPETKEKNKIFETVRLKARLTMAEMELEKLRGEIEQLKAAPAEYQDRNMRLMADMENLRRRTEREKADTAKFAITRFARDVLTVADNFQRAIDAVPKDAAADDGPLKTLFEGVELIGRELLTTLERHGVKRIDPTGERFDPNLHQAMMQVENTEVPSGTVLQSFQPAYMLEDRVLRPAMVIVSTGGPKTPKPAEAPAGDAGAAEGESGGAES